MNGNDASSNSGRRNGDATTEDEGSSQRRARSVQPTLAYRRIDVDYSSTRHCQNLAFLNSQTILALDSCGDLDIIGLPLSGSSEESERCGNDESSSANSTGKGDNRGAGTHLARMSLSPAKIGSHQPRPPISQHRFQLFGYQNGERFAVGLPSG